MKIKGIKQEYGITIVSLVVTIIVLIILAGISISLLFGKSGIITRAKKGQEIADVATAQEKLELIKSEIPMKILDGKDSTVNLNNYLEELNKEKNKKDCDVTNIEKLNDINAEITISGKYKFLAKDEENGNVKIIYLGEAGGLQIAPTEATYRYPTAGTFEVINNESQGKLTVKSSNEEIAKASISGTTVTVTPKKMAGTAKIVVTSEANGKYAEGRVTHTAKVENGTILLDAEPYIAEYDGKAHDALISVTVDPKDCKLEYSLDGGEFTEIMPKVTMAAEEYTISIKASKEGYTTNAITKTVTINKQSNTNGNLVLTPASGTITYPNNGTFTVSKNVSGGALSVKSSDTSVATASISGTTVTITPKVPTTDGKKTTITVTSAATSNYEAQTATYVAKIEMGTITINATPYKGTYDGKSHPALTTVSTNPTGTTIEYSLNGGTYSTTMPQVTGASTYSISIRATKAGYAKAETTKTITVGKQSNTNGNLVLTPASGTITYPNNGTFTVSKNVSGGALSVKSSDESIATASISGTTVTVTPKIPSVNGKQVTITVTSSATSNYEAQTATYIATVKMGTITINATAYKGNYDGKSHPALTAVSTNPTGTTIEYSLNGGTYSSTMPQVTGASEYSISIRATKAGYAKAETTKTVTVGKQTNTNGNLTLSATSGTITYPNNGTFTVTKNTSGGTLSVSSSDTSIATASISGTTVTITPKVPTTDGKKTTITVTSAATSNYEAQTATYVATVNMGKITINATPYNGNYDGKSHPALTAVSTNPTGTTIEYSLNGGTYSTTMPQVTGASTYSISIRATKAGYAKAETTKTITVGKQSNTNGNLVLTPASGTITYPNNGTFTVSKNVSGGALSVKSSDESIATASISGTTVTVTPKTPSVNGKQVTITVTSAATSNYESQTSTYVATINMGTITIDATIYKGTYNGKQYDALTSVKVVPDGCNIQYALNGGTFGSTIPKVTNAGTFSVTVKASKAGYIEKVVTITNGKIDNSATATASGVNKVYNGSAQTGVTGNNVDWSGTTSATNVGTYTAYATPKTNYAWSDGTKRQKEITWKITPAEITLDATVYSGIYDGKAHNAVSNVKVTPSDCKVEYSLNGGTYSSTMPTVTNAGSFSVAIRASKSNYTTKGITKTSKIENAKTATASAVNRTYTGSAQTGVTGNNVDWSGTTSATNAGTYTAYATPKTNYSWSDGKVDKRAVVWKIGEATITITATPYSGTYDGKAHQALTSVKVVPDGCTVTYSLNGGTYSSTMPTVTNVGAFTVSIKATKANYTNKEITINTGKVNYSKASSASGINKVYNGSAQTGVTGQYVTWGGTTSATNVGTYTAYATPDSNHAWSDGTRTQKTVQWSITPAEITLDATVYSGTYDGKAHNAVSNVKVTPSDSTITYSIDGGKTYTSTVPTVTNAESFSVIVKATRANYSTKEITKTSKIENAKTATSSAVNRTYNGSAQTGVTGNNVDWSGSTSGTNAGSYTAYATPKTNYAWSDGKVDKKAVVWTMSPKSLKDCTVTIGTLEYTYDGGAKQPSVTVKDGNVTLANGTEYTVTYVDNINAGTASVGIIGKGNYSGTVTKTFTISQKTGGVTLSATSGKITNPTKATFTVTKNVSGGKLSVSSSNGSVATASISGNTITVTPGTTSGTATITVTSAATTNYKVASATYSIDVHNHTASCYSTACKGSFKQTASNSTIYKTCSHSHTVSSNQKLMSGTSLTDGAKYLPTWQGGDANSTTTQPSITGSCYATKNNCSNYGKALPMGFDQFDPDYKKVTNTKTKCQQCGKSITTYYEYNLTRKCNTCGWTWKTKGGANLCSKTCGIKYYSSGTHIAYCRGVYYTLSCGKTAGTSNYTRTVITYTCNGCGATATYYSAASYGTCPRCGGNHSVSASGSTSTTHKAVDKYLICGR